MKLGVLGLATVVVGVVLSSVGLVGIGAFWVVMGLVAHGLRPRLAVRNRTPGDPPPSRGQMLLGVALMLAVGVPSLVVGILTPGIEDGDAGWRWLPLGVGLLSAGIGVTSGLLYGAASGISAATGASKPRVPGTIWIRSVRETGTYINERPRLELGLRVEPDPGTGMAEFEVTKRATVPFTALASARVGGGFRAQVVGPDDPEEMDIDWDAPVGGPGAGLGEVSERLAELDRLREDERITDDEYRTQRRRILDSI